MNPRLNHLHPYPFQKLKELCTGLKCPAELEAINLTIGEPKHKPPAIVLECLASHLSRVAHYPPTAGSIGLREALASWLCKRFSLPDNSIDPASQVLPVNGTREALFAIAQCIYDNTSNKKKILMPNPFYQIYEGAALLAGAEPCFYNCVAEQDYQPDFASIPEVVWQQCQLLYICTPGNPSGAVLSVETLTQLIELSAKYQFVIVSDECYSEIYPDENNKPVGLLEAAAAAGNINYKRCLVFNSLSKRSNLPGLRSGLVAGDSEIIKQFLIYRTYHGCAMPAHADAASAVAWGDESHVLHNRELYREKFPGVLRILGEPLKLLRPDAGFFLWININSIDTDFTRHLYRSKGVKVLPGSFLSRDSHGINPGDHHLRLALVAPMDQCIEASSRIADYLTETNTLE